MVKKLVFVTATRADFGKILPLAVVCRDAGFHVSFFVTGMHMLECYGLTKNEVHGVPGVKVNEFLNQREDDPQDIILAKTVLGFSDFCHENKPDLVVFHGDRIEALAVGLVCATNYIRSAHIEGGEVSGTIDEVFRHCNSKLAHHHFVSSQDAAKRVSALGEAANSINVIGSPELDLHLRPSGVTLAEVKSRYAIPFVEYGIVLFHPVTSEEGDMGNQAKSVFGELIKSGKSFVVIAPNNDPGASEIRAVIYGLPQEQFRVLPSMRFFHFSELMRNASVMIGNSSAGVREAPFLGLSSLDLGTRQTNRANAASIVHASPYDCSAIKEFLVSRWNKRYARQEAFGEGTAAERFLYVIKSEFFWSQPMQKVFSSGTLQ